MEPDPKRKKREQGAITSRAPALSSPPRINGTDACDVSAVGLFLSGL